MTRPAEIRSQGAGLAVQGGYTWDMTLGTPAPAGSAGTTARTTARHDPYRRYRSLLGPRRVQELSRLRPRRVVLDAAWCWLSIAVAWLAVAIWTRWWLVLMALPVIGVRYYALFIIGHDGLHRRLFARAQTNDLFNDLVVLGPIGAITRINNRNHLGHHSHLASTEDPDRHRHGCFNKTDRSELLAYLSGLASVGRSVRNVFGAPRELPRAERAEDAQRYRLRDLLILAGWQVALIGGLTLAVGWWGYPVLWVLPVYVFTFLGDNLRSFLEHSHPEADERADRHRLVTYLASPVERCFLAPMNMNYHAAHHLWPSIPYYNLPIADRELRAQPGTPGLEWRRSYLGYLWRYWRALPLEECRARAGSAPA